MFTGIIEEVGSIKNIRSGGTFASLSIRCQKVLGKGGSLHSSADSDPQEIPTKIGDSIAVNGVCLTVTKLGSDFFEADVMPETLSRTAFRILKPGSPVNLERAMPVYGRFGGHIVSGHIDGTGTIREIRRDGNAVWYDISVPEEIGLFIVEKGSIAIDGISLTVAKTSPNTAFSVSIIPHTLAETALAVKRTGDPVNLETDMIGKYVNQSLRYGTAGPAEESPRAENTNKTGNQAPLSAEEKYRKLFG